MVQLQEFGSKYESETLRNSKKLDMADVIIYVHDSSDTNSFSYISNLRVSRRFRGLLYTSRLATGLVLGLGLGGATGMAVLTVRSNSIR